MAIVESSNVKSLVRGVPVMLACPVALLGMLLLQQQTLDQFTGGRSKATIDPDDYVVRASSHANELQRLTKLRKGLRRQVLGSPVMDAGRFAGHFESALRGMWQRWCNQQE